MNETAQKIEALAQNLYRADGHTAPCDAWFSQRASSAAETSTNGTAAEGIRDEYRQKARLQLAQSGE